MDEGTAMGNGADGANGANGADGSAAGTVRVTIDDVARAAGVSRQTVSRAMNGKGEISAATRRRVLATIEELDYRPSMFARGMRTHRAGTLGLILSDIANPFFPAVARGVFDAAAALGFSVVVHNTDAHAGRESAAAREILERGAEGVIGFFEALGDEELVGLHRRVPLVVADRRAPAPGVASVSSDFATGTRLAVEHLQARGHRHLGMLDGAVGVDHVRRHAFTAATAPRTPVVTAPPTITGGAAAAAQLLGEHPEVTGLFAFNDLMAVGAIRALRERGRRVPDDCAVVGYDDLTLAADLDPPLTTVHTDKYELGRTLVEVLDGVVRARRDESGAAAEHRLLPAALVVRRSG
ncbi:LacI family transcriptional regulator [Actinomycetospora sp. NBRC 106375]|uniref:LacI family DNA-binding transcriptional regulator n=1 Tax=Actinomycetospora sp. NBRC 106375 TaxID=3032207 RepID=UPI0024A0B99C|nr:LacI family DNA-binding transcriptional regulator [Actinomycetospora sp. NBRC 106375]GLZ47531.1 LacI family transcriptional regulator [Actinomycetospora sp. NBRC 106375]